MDKIFVMATKKVSDECLKKADDWLRPSGGIFSDARSLAKHAVAEYLANEKGFTLYESIATYPKDKS